MIRRKISVYLDLYGYFDKLAHRAFGNGVIVLILVSDIFIVKYISKAVKSFVSTFIYHMDVYSKHMDVYG